MLRQFILSRKGFYAVNPSKNSAKVNVLQNACSHTKELILVKSTVAVNAVIKVSGQLLDRILNKEYDKLEEVHEGGSSTNGYETEIEFEEEDTSPIPVEEPKGMGMTVLRNLRKLWFIGRRDSEGTLELINNLEENVDEEERSSLV